MLFESPAAAEALWAAQQAALPGALWFAPKRRLAVTPAEMKHLPQGGLKGLVAGLDEPPLAVPEDAQALRAFSQAAPRWQPAQQVLPTKAVVPPSGAFEVPSQQRQVLPRVFP